MRSAAPALLLLLTLACFGGAPAEREPAPLAVSPPPPAAPEAAALPEPELPRPQDQDEPFTVVDALRGQRPRNQGCLRIIEIEIRKSRRRLIATCESGQRYEFPAAIGRRPLGHKSEMGDLRTPEGQYRVAEAPRPSQFHRFMLLDYPSREDADRAIASGLISDLTHAKIAAAHARSELPPQDTELGGLIGIHGEGQNHQGESARRDWTFGCIAISDLHIEFIAPRVQVGVPVRIVP
jgi:murein L,D-transpeptidase YafK